MKSFKLIDSNWFVNLVLAGILFTPLFFVTDFRHFPNFGKGLFFFTVCTIFIVSVLFTVNWSRTKLWFRHPLVTIAAGWFLITVLSTILGVNSYVSFWGQPERLGGLITAIYIFVLLIALIVNLQKDSAMRVLAVVGLVGGTVGLHAIGQKLGWDPTWPSFERPVATFGNPIFLSTFLIMTVFVALYFVLQSSQLWLKLLYGVLFIAQIVALFLAMSRGPSIGLVVGLGIFVAGLWWIKFAEQRARFWKALGITFVVGLILLGALYLVREPLGIQRLFDYSVLKQGSTYDRLIIMQSVFQGAQERPILGYGPENIYVAYNRHYNPTIAESGYRETFADRAHSVVIDQLAANGWLGLIAMLIFVGGLLVITVRWLRRAQGVSEKVLAVTFLATIIAYFVQDLVEFDIISNYVYGAVLVAALLCLSATTPSITPKMKINWLNWTGGLVLLGVGVYTIFGIYLPSWRGGALVKQAFEAYAWYQDYEKANVLYNGAFDIESPYAHWYLREDYAAFIAEYADSIFGSDRGLVSYLLDKGTERMEKFIKREPEDVQGRFNYAGLNLILDDLLEGRHEGDKLFETLLKENPNREFFYLAWGKGLYLSRRVEEAKEKILQSMQFSKVPVESYFWLGVIEATLGDEEAALDNMHQAALKPTDSIDSKNHLEFAVSYLLERKRYEDAIPLQIRLTSINSKNLQYWLNLAVLYRDTGQTELARQTAGRILRLFPDTRDDVADFVSSL